MADCCKRDSIKIGMRVRIVEKKNYQNGQMTEGVVERILTDSSEHPHGIMVQLTRGAIGRVRQIIDENNSVNAALAHDNISTGQKLIDILNNGENHKVEFKSTFRFDIKKFLATGIRDRSRDAEKSISKTVAAFMNADGGILLIGVDDNANVIGIENDLDILDRKSTDMLRLQIKNSLDSYLRNKIIYEHFSLDFLPHGDQKICIIRVTPSPEPVFVNDGGKQECYVRVDNESKPFLYDEFHKYWNRRNSKLL